jgi:hypothetical protein
MLDANDYEAIRAEQIRIRGRLAGYDGGFDFLKNMRDIAARDPEYNFSIPQLEAIARCLDRETSPRKAPNENLLRFPDTFLKGTHHFAVSNAEGGTTFLRVDRPDEGKWNGWTFVRVEMGPADMRIGSQKPNGEYRGQWPDMIDQLIADPKTALQRYGREIGSCGVCGLRLTDEVSREYGIGPICRNKLGW